MTPTIEWNFRRDYDGVVPQRHGGSREWAEGVIREENEHPQGVALTLVYREVGDWQEVVDDD
jgi:hypothetical protein